MVVFKAQLQKLETHGEKTGWTCIFVPGKITETLKPGVKKSFRVKGFIDDHPLKAVSLLPAGDGTFILAVNAAMRKAIKKIHGAEVKLKLETDNEEFRLSKEMIRCLKDDPEAEVFFTALPPSHQHWFSNWISGAKTEATKSRRIATTVKACGLKMSFGEMMRQYREERNFIQ